jgi:hypothetical protein
MAAGRVGTRRNLGSGRGRVREQWGERQGAGTVGEGQEGEGQEGEGQGAGAGGDVVPWPLVLANQLLLVRDHLDTHAARALWAVTPEGRYTG